MRLTKFIAAVLLLTSFHSQAMDNKEPTNTPEQQDKFPKMDRETDFYVFNAEKFKKAEVISYLNNSKKHY